MITETENARKTNLNDVISKAISKVAAKNEAELCHYLPAMDGGRLHHFGMKKMKIKHPGELLILIKEHVIEHDHPVKLPVRPRRQRAKNREKEHLSVKVPKSQVNILMDLLKKFGNPELAALFSEQLTFPQVQKLMIKMIRAQDVDQNLWEKYVNMIKEKMS